MSVETLIASGLALAAIVVMAAIAVIDRRILSGMRAKENEDETKKT